MLATIVLASALAMAGQNGCTRHARHSCEDGRESSGAPLAFGAYGTPPDTPQNRADRALQQTAACLIERVPATARKVMNSDLGSDGERKQVKSVLAVAPTCYQHNWPKFDPTALHNALAQQYYQSRFTTNDPGIRPGVQPPESFAVVPAGTHGDERQQGVWFLGAIASCVTFADPEDVRALVLGPMGVDEEGRRFDQLRPAITRCVAGDAADKMTARLLRGYLAWALLRRTVGAEIQ